MRCPAPGHTCSGTNCHTPGTLPDDMTDQTLTLLKTSPGKRKPTVIFVAVLRTKVHQIKGCSSVFLQTLRCFIWHLGLCIGVKLVLPLPGLESGAGLAGYWAVAVAWTMWRNPAGILAVFQHMCKLQLQRHNLDKSLRVDFHAWGKWHILTYKFFSPSTWRPHSKTWVHLFGFFSQKTATTNVFFFFQPFWLKWTVYM